MCSAPWDQVAPVPIKEVGGNDRALERTVRFDERASGSTGSDVGLHDGGLEQTESPSFPDE
jgi:hypothetical protein